MPCRLLAATLLLCGCLLSAAERDWTERRPAVSPSSRYKHAMVYDPARKQVVLFGGMDARNGDLLDDTWTWNGTVWTRRNPATRPQPRARHSMAWDSVRRRVLLFGPEETGKELWAWDGENWSIASLAPLPPTAGKPVLAGASIAFDSARGSLTVHRSEDAWAWDGTAWRTLPAPDASYRPYALLAYDSLRAVTMLFGGAQYTFLNDTWLWDGTAWRSAEPAVPPRPRDLAALAYDSRRGTAILFGGNVAANGWVPPVPSADTWAWDGRSWATVPTRQSPPATVGAALAYDSSRDEVVLFGGYGTADSDTSWTGTWVLTSGEVPAESSFFDSFTSDWLRYWSPAGGDAGGCTAARGPQGNIFCSTPDFLTASTGQITLRGRVEKRARKGSEIALRSALPAQGTFAARVRLSGPDEGTWGNASIKAFFTYTPHPDGTDPCSHMEHDFEALTGTSALYGMSGQWMAVDNWRSGQVDWAAITGAWKPELPMLANVTHAHEGGSGCPASSPMSRASLAPFGGHFVTLVVTVNCLAEPCVSADAPYEARYFAGRDDGWFIQTAVTRTTHRLLEDGLHPMFNVWWLDPRANTPDKTVYPRIAPASTADQVMEIDWFLWNKSILTFEEAHRKGAACDAAGRAGPHGVPNGGCQ